MFEYLIHMFPLTVPEPLYRQHENMKRREYEMRVQEIEHAYGNFSPLVFSSSGGMGASSYYCSLATSVCGPSS